MQAPPPPTRKSLALGRLYEAIILRNKAIAGNKLDKETADKEVYNACHDCYSSGLTRTELNPIIKAVVSEFRQPVA